MAYLGSGAVLGKTVGLLAGRPDLLSIVIANGAVFRFVHHPASNLAGGEGGINFLVTGRRFASAGILNPHVWWQLAERHGLHFRPLLLIMRHRGEITCKTDAR